MRSCVHSFWIQFLAELRLSKSRYPNNSEYYNNKHYNKKDSKNNFVISRVLHNQNHMECNLW